jgi:hypothetical protein
MARDTTIRTTILRVGSNNVIAQRRSMGVATTIHPNMASRTRLLNACGPHSLRRRVRVRRILTVVDLDARRPVGSV